jgi:hypothetical protein
MAGYGMQGHLMFNFQNSFGTSQVDSLQAIPILSESLTYNIDQIEQNNLDGKFVANSTLKGATGVEGDIEMEAEPQALGYFLKAFTGSDSVTDYTHTFKMAKTDFDERAASVPFTCEVFRDVGSAFLYFDLMASTFELSVSNGELLNTSIGVVGAGFSRQAASSATYPTGAGVVPFKWDESSCQFNSAALFDLRDLTISGNKNLEAVHTLVNTTAPRKIKRNGFETIELSGTMLFQSHSYMQAFEAQSENSLVVHFASTSASLTLDFPSFKFTEFSPVMGGPEIVEASFSGRAEYNANSATQMEITLTNVRTLSY